MKPEINTETAATVQTTGDQAVAPAATCSALNAGSVAAGPDRYTVTHTHDHKTLKTGDVVVMGETPRMENVLIRVEDMTVHGICGDADQYVHLEPNKENSHPKG